MKFHPGMKTPYNQPLSHFRTFLDYALNLDKCEIAGIEVLKKVNLGLYVMKNINLTKEKIKILRVSIYCNKKIQDDLNFSKTIKNLCNIITL